MLQIIEQCIDLKQDLRQGDILRQTPELLKILEDYHSYYFQRREYYQYYMVLTQSCDLVRRSSPDCKSDYITLCAIRPVNDALDRIFFTVIEDEWQRNWRIGTDQDQSRLNSYLERLINNNFPDFFYLREDFENGLGEDFCAFLRLNIPIKASLHYETCVCARMARLTSQFSAKLAWTLGNLYARIGTDDWPPKEKREIIDELLSTSGFIWRDRTTVKAAKSRVATDGKEVDEVQREVDSIVVKSKKEEVIDQVIELVTVHTELSDEQLLKLKRQLASNTIISNIR